MAAKGWPHLGPVAHDLPQAIGLDDTKLESAPTSERERRV